MLNLTKIHCFAPGIYPISFPADTQNDRLWTILPHHGNAPQRYEQLLCVSFCCGRISFHSRFQASTRHFCCVFSVLLRALPTLYSLSSHNPVGLSPFLEADPFSVTALLYHVALRKKKYIPPSILLNNHIARSRAVRVTGADKIHM